jgi:Tol biopolymer transport system component/DNA-binding winged helix-turn-helix (wHTH) protein
MRLEPKPSYEFGPFRLDPSEHRLLRDGRPIPLTPKAFDVLRTLVESGGHLVEKEKLLKEVWPDSFVEEGALNRCVSVLRKALHDSSSGQQYIETVPKRGYRFVAPVSVVGVENGQPDWKSHPLVLLRLGGVVSKQTAAIAALLLAIGALWYGVLRRSGPETNAVLAAPAHTQVTFTGKEGAPAISPDGRRSAYVSHGLPENTVIVQELDGGQPLAIFNAPEVGHLRWSPDGSDLLIWARGAGKDGVYVVPQLGGSAHTIAPGQFVACWSPDGSTIAVARPFDRKISFHTRLGVVRRTVSLAGIHSWITDIDWSPATGLLLFVSADDKGRSTIWTIHSDGRDQKSILAADAEIPAARWDSQGRAVYYFQRANQTVSLYKIPAQPGQDNGDAALPTLISGLESDGAFALSADGRRLVYARAPYYSNLRVLEANADGESLHGGTQELTHGTSHIERPRISPDGTAIIFNIGHEPLANVYTLPVTGGSPKQLTFFDSFTVGAVWSRDGGRIAFASTQGGKARVWIVDADGGAPHATSSGPLSDSFDLSWAPGSRLLYQVAGNRDYYELDPDTGQERPLLRDRSVGWVFAPVYSPDGRKVAVAWNRHPHRGIWVIDVSDRHESPVYTASNGPTMPIGWSADATSIYAVEGKRPIYRGLTLPRGETLTEAKVLEIPVNGGDVKTAASFPPREEIGSVTMTPDGRKFIYTAYSSRSDVWIVDNFDVSIVTSRAPKEASSRPESPTAPR